MSGSGPARRRKPTCENGYSRSCLQALSAGGGSQAGGVGRGICQAAPSFFRWLTLPGTQGQFAQNLTPTALAKQPAGAVIRGNSIKNIDFLIVTSLRFLTIATILVCYTLCSQSVL